MVSIDIRQFISDMLVDRGQISDGVSLISENAIESTKNLFKSSKITENQKHVQNNFQKKTETFFWRYHSPFPTHLVQSILENLITLKCCYSTYKTQFFFQKFKEQKNLYFVLRYSLRCLRSCMYNTGHFEFFIHFKNLFPAGILKQVFTAIFLAEHVAEKVLYWENWFLIDCKLLFYNNMK